MHHCYMCVPGCCGMQCPHFFFFFEKLRSMRKVEVRLNLGLELLPAASNFPLLFVIVVQ